MHNRSERNGTIALMVIVVCILAASEIFSRVYTPPAPNAALLAAVVDSISAQSSEGVLDSWQDSTRTYFTFNPNTLNDSGFAALGFSEREIATLRKYQAAGATFKIKKDFARLYFVDDLVYERLQPYIDLPETHARKHTFNNQDNSKTKWSDTASFALYARENLRVDLNTADTIELDAVSGIGPFYARQIVERRQELGGYHSIGQLMELWNMKPESIDRFADKVWIDTSHIVKIPVNTATAQELAIHPYITSYMASRIVLKREEDGPYADVGDMVSRGLLDAQLSLKLAPYLQF